MLVMYRVWRDTVSGPMALRKENHKPVGNPSLDDNFSQSYFLANGVKGSIPITNYDSDYSFWVTREFT